MTTTIKIYNKPVQLQLSSAAQRALAARNKPLYAEMELYFSCLIRLKVRFYDHAEHGNGITAGDKLVVSFRPVMTRTCGNDYEGDEPPLTDFPIARKEAFVPKWLRIDFQRGQWIGEFGMSEPQPG
ncbi:MAG: hypothetical protein LJE74_08550 [Proteobacteria bacterium]|jgi:hypothetical protein|nr:hypothetical protein [Pseudomonadota bacterium]MCG6935826.1 hypothetical protein [Pseudomonadota bacterium]